MNRIYDESNLFATWRGIEIHHSLEGRDPNDPLSNVWFVPDGDGEYEFSVADISSGPIVQGPVSAVYQVQYAIDHGLIKLPNEPHESHKTCGGDVLAHYATDDFRREFDIEITEYLKQAEPAELIKIAFEEFGPGEQSDQIAYYYEERDYRVAEAFAYQMLVSESRSRESIGFQVSVDRDAMMAWLKRNREESYWLVREALGEVVKVSGEVTENLTIQKEVIAYVDADLVEEDDAIHQAIRDKAYEETIHEGDHGWGAIDTHDVETVGAVVTEDQPNVMTV